MRRSDRDWPSMRSVESLFSPFIHARYSILNAKRCQGVYCDEGLSVPKQSADRARHFSNDVSPEMGSKINEESRFIEGFRLSSLDARRLVSALGV